MEATYDRLAQRALDRLLLLQQQQEQQQEEEQEQQDTTTAATANDDDPSSSSDNNNTNTTCCIRPRRRQQHCRVWIGLAGAPGSGKTTVAEAVVKRINALVAATATATATATTTDQLLLQPNNNNAPLAICLPMDGYHYSQYQMKHEFRYSMKRRGAPWTFNAESMIRDLLHAKQQEQQQQQQQNGNDDDDDDENGALDQILFPGYSREISDPVADQIQLQPHHRIVIVEGLYVLLGHLAAAASAQEPTPAAADSLSSVEQLRQALDSMMEGTDTDWRRMLVDDNDDGRSSTTTTTITTYSIYDELDRWKPLWEANVWDDTWFVAPPMGLMENKRRLVTRSLRTWTPEKTLLWSSCGGGGNDNDDDDKGAASAPGDPAGVAPVRISDREAAERRVEFNDMKNARLVALCQPLAQVSIDSI